MKLSEMTVDEMFKALNPKGHAVKVCQTKDPIDEVSSLDGRLSDVVAWIENDLNNNDDAAYYLNEVASIISDAEDTLQELQDAYDDTDEEDDYTRRELDNAMNDCEGILDEANRVYDDIEEFTKETK